MRDSHEKGAARAFGRGASERAFVARCDAVGAAVMGVAMEMAVEEAGLMVVSRKRGAPANGDAPTGTDATAEQQRWLIQSGRLRCGALLHTGHSQSDAPIAICQVKTQFWGEKCRCLAGRRWSELPVVEQRRAKARCWEPLSAGSVTRPPQDCVLDRRKSLPPHTQSQTLSFSLAETAPEFIEFIESCCGRGPHGQASDCTAPAHPLGSAAERQAEMHGSDQ